MLSRRRSLLALSVAAILFTPSTESQPTLMPATSPVAKADRCGTYPKVSAKKDCWVVENLDIAKTWRNKHVAKCIRKWESGHNYEAVSKRGSFRGAYQFKQSTFDSVGPNRFKGLRANNAPKFLQDLKARRLYRKRGLQPWPTPRRRCG